MKIIVVILLIAALSAATRIKTSTIYTQNMTYPNAGCLRTTTVTKDRSADYSGYYELNQVLKTVINCPNGTTSTCTCTNNTIVPIYSY